MKVTKMKIGGTLVAVLAAFAVLVMTGCGSGAGGDENGDDNGDDFVGELVMGTVFNLRTNPYFQALPDGATGEAVTPNTVPLLRAGGDANITVAIAVEGGVQLLTWTPIDTWAGIDLVNAHGTSRVMGFRAGDTVSIGLRNAGAAASGIRLDAGGFHQGVSPQNLFPAVTVAAGGVHTFEFTLTAAHIGHIAGGTPQSIRIVSGTANNAVVLTELLVRGIRPTDFPGFVPDQADLTYLDTALAAAIAARDSAVVSVDGEDIPTTTLWVTAEVMAALVEAIAAAQVVLGNVASTQADIDAQVTALNAASAIFNAAREYGTSDCISATLVGNATPVDREVPYGATIVLGDLPGGMAALIEADHFDAVAPAEFGTADGIVFVSNLNVDNVGGLVILPAGSDLQPGDVVRGTGRTTLTAAFGNSRLEVAAIDGGSGSSVGLGGGLFGANYSIVSGNFAFTFILRESDIESGLRISPNTWTGGAAARPDGFAFSIDDMIVFRPLPPTGDWIEVFSMAEFIDYAGISDGDQIPATDGEAVFARNSGFAGVQWVAGNPVDGMELSARVGPRTGNWHDVRFDLDGLYYTLGIAVQVGDEVTIAGRAVTVAADVDWGRRVEVRGAASHDASIAADFTGTHNFNVTLGLTATIGHVSVAGNGGGAEPNGITYIYIDNIIIEGYRD